MPILDTPAALIATLIAVILVGLSKGGLGGMSLLGVPIMAMVMSPVTAAAILLPVLVVMDVVSVASWRKWVDWRLIALLMPGALAGIGIGWFTAEMVSDAVVRLIVGVVSAAFVLRVLAQHLMRREVQPRGQRPAQAQFWAAIAGYTSFVAHAGAPPLQIYMMPLKLDPKLYTGTLVMFFAITNALKLIPYFALGQFGAENLTASALLLPLAVVSTWAGAWAVRRMRADIFYQLTYVSVALVAVKLIWDGIAGI
ncbi:sulfite exporter TauE/SafE family protein [Paracoccus sp. IB05]|uniref:sulfite exporter TauE/SafE family protein n=1 Tax=Paracoccus sp. IB05 TaxID=2779367 RepID=UPI0018E70A7D|nr:sulfite exporter TauE/SafE family protein [Paracoccus sp. IB05]MBJ2149453.1 sulfite exporter TauE/SafE family protein [Paracoccus sp. IB05]